MERWRPARAFMYLAGMKPLRIYTDTSVIGGCFDAEFAPWSNGLFKDFEMGTYRPVVSAMVAAEIEDAPERVREKYAELLTLGAEILEVGEEVVRLADVYQARRILTPKFYDDGVHIALATVAQVDLLVSWNFRHIVHYDKIRLFSAVNLEFGYKPLEIYSPREVAHYGEEGI
ncbi:MAG TPA: type II toxin-antitoxin system VapC family toxin [Longimicrobiaceae bacterium]